jgi:ABC-type Fe3+ transport system permease subunit
MNFDELGLEFPDEVTVQLRVTSGMAYALRELANAYKRLAKSSEEAAQAFTEHLAQIAADV